MEAPKALTSMTGNHGRTIGMTALFSNQLVLILSPSCRTTFEAGKAAEQPSITFGRESLAIQLMGFRIVEKFPVKRTISSWLDIMAAGWH